MSSPRWLIALSKSIEAHKESTVYQIATIDASSTQPRARTIVHRAFLTPKSPAAPLLISTTDARTPKAAQLPLAPATEVAWWIAPTQEQFRIAGRAYVLPTSTNQLSKSFPGTQLAGNGFDWENHRKKVFNEMSGHMRASWCRPVPGTKMPGTGGYDEAKNWPTTLPKLGETESEEEEKLVEEALKNFALVVIDPHEVDYVELAVLPNQRTRFTRDGTNWTEEIVVP